MIMGVILAPASDRTTLMKRRLQRILSGRNQIKYPTLFEQNPIWR
jgi:hypothetical protein